ncbi:MAG: hypothetical protein ACYCVD_00415 [Desulfitobacteriaceae bacterium]
MFYQERLIVGYIIEPDHDRYMFQIAGGEEKDVSREDFVHHWQIYRQYEKEREAQHPENYRPLPITLEIHRSSKVIPVNFAIRRQRRSA